jgi:trans-aconitate methyltransferase
LTQTWDPVGYGRDAGFVPALGLPLIEWLAPRAGERILDLGCGDGALTERLAGRGCELVGVDTSAALVAAARGRGLDARLMDGQSLTFDSDFDAVFSNAALHWMTRPAAVIAGVGRALRPGGRFVGELGGEGNVETIHAALRAALRRRGLDSSPGEITYFPSLATYRAALEGAGFRVERIETFPRATPLPTGMSGWLRTFALSYLAVASAPDREGLVDEVIEAVRPRLCDADGNWHADYVRLRFAATRP